MSIIKTFKTDLLIEKKKRQPVIKRIHTNDIEFNSDCLKLLEELMYYNIQERGGIFVYKKGIEKYLIEEMYETVNETKEGKHRYEGTMSDEQQRLINFKAQQVNSKVGFYHSHLSNSVELSKKDVDFFIQATNIEKTTMMMVVSQSDIALYRMEK